MRQLTFILLILFFIPGVAYASWWNPFSWKIFSDVSIKNKIESISDGDSLVCNNQKWNKCLEGQVFVCPEDGSDAFCEKVPPTVKIPKLKDEQRNSGHIYQSLQNKNCDEQKKIANDIIIKHKQESESAQLAESLIRDKYEAGRRELLQQFSKRQGIFYIDPNIGYSPDQIQDISNTSAELYHSMIDNSAMDASKRIEQILEIKKKSDRILKEKLRNLQIEYPYCQFPI